MTPKRYATIGAIFGLILGYILGGGASWTQMVGSAIAGGIVGFALFPAGRVSPAQTKKRFENE